MVLSIHIWCLCLVSAPWHKDIAHAVYGFRRMKFPVVDIQIKMAKQLVIDLYPRPNNAKQQAVDSQRQTTFVDAACFDMKRNGSFC